MFSKRFRVADNSTSDVPLITPPDEDISRTPTDCGAGNNFCLLRGVSFKERAPSIPNIPSPSAVNYLPELSSFRPEAVDAQGFPIMKASVTPMASRRASFEQPVEEMTPPDTPIFARVLHLVDTDISIYKKEHGDDENDHPLCLHCFRLHGSFNRLLEHGYETCGKEDPLESHYWDTLG